MPKKKKEEEPRFSPPSIHLLIFAMKVAQDKGHVREAQINFEGDGCSTATFVVNAIDMPTGQLEYDDFSFAENMMLYWAERVEKLAKER